MAAYPVGFVRVTDPETYRRYAERTPKVAAQHGGRFLARGGRLDPLEGHPIENRGVAAEFRDLAAARAFYDWDAYRELRASRASAATTDLVVVEGLSFLEPGEPVPSNV